MHPPIVRRTSRAHARWIAVEFEGNRITYRELNRRANQLAHHLINLGVGPESWSVFASSAPSKWLLDCWGFSKPAAAYVAAGSSYPKERLEFMLDDAQVSALLTQENLLDRDCKRSTLGSSMLPGLPRSRLAVIRGAKQTTTQQSRVGIRESGLRYLHLRLYGTTERCASLAPLGG